MPYKILAVDDELPILQLLSEYVRTEGYLFYTAQSGQEALEQMEKGPDLILLDVNMPDMDGLEVCRRIRSHVDCPILFLTAKVEEQDRIKGLLIGGDDYILKPFSIQELGARVTAHLRRQGRLRAREELKFSGDLVINYTEKAVWCAQQPISLTRTEFGILEQLSLNKGVVFGKEQLYELVRGYDGSADSSIIAEHVRRIRLKLGAYSNTAYIETVWGIGYKWIG